MVCVCVCVRVCACVRNETTPNRCYTQIERHVTQSTFLEHGTSRGCSRVGLYHCSRIEQHGLSSPLHTHPRLNESLFLLLLRVLLSPLIRTWLAHASSVSCRCHSVMNCSAPFMMPVYHLLASCAGLIQLQHGWTNHFLALSTPSQWLSSQNRVVTIRDYVRYPGNFTG